MEKIAKDIFFAASAGNVNELRELLDKKSITEKRQLVSIKNRERTPLIIASLYGKHNVVNYLIEECQADIEQVGWVTFDWEQVDEAPPLWCAAASGKLRTVKCLLGHKAQVNSVTKTLSTPLRAACFNGILEVVKTLVEAGADIDSANIAGSTNLMISCLKGYYDVSKYLIECGAEINKKCNMGRTALHDCAEINNLKLLKLLLQNGAVNIPDNRGETPLLTAAIDGKELCVEYFVQGSYCSEQEKINALEILGAFFISENVDMNLALNYWKRSKELRNEDRDCVVEYPKSGSHLGLYLNKSEFQTLSQLEELMINPDELELQALMIRDRILGPDHPNNAFYIRMKGRSYALNQRFKDCVKLYVYAFRVKGNRLDIFRICDTFSKAMSESIPFNDGYPSISIQDLFCCLETVFKEIKRTVRVSERLHSELVDHATGITYMFFYLVGLLLRLQTRLNDNEKFAFKEAVYTFLNFNLSTMRQWSPLHFACSSGISSYGLFLLENVSNQWEVVHLLLELGASPNVLDSDHASPLHIAAENKCPRDIFDSMLNHGAHLDISNNKRQTPLMLINLDINPLQHINLQCLSAKVIQDHKISYKGILHEKLEEFVDLH